MLTIVNYTYNIAFLKLQELRETFVFGDIVVVRHDAFAVVRGLAERQRKSGHVRVANELLSSIYPRLQQSGQLAVFVQACSRHNGNLYVGVEDVDVMEIFLSMKKATGVFLGIKLRTSSFKKLFLYGDPFLTT